MAIKLLCFDSPGRAETTRLILTFGGVDFEDVRLTREQWPAFKPKTPFGRIPAMEINGTWVAETLALERYAAAVANLLPADPLQLAIAEQVYSLTMEASQLVAPTLKSDKEARLAAQEELFRGELGETLRHISSFLKGKKFVLGDELCYVDLRLFHGWSMLRATLPDSFLRTFVTDFAPIAAHHTTVGTLPKVKEYYAGRTGIYVYYQVEK